MDWDITIIGAGVIGLSIAAELADNKKNIIIVEKNESHGMGISSRNSEVIHAGLYYPSDSMKAKLCVEGRPLLYETCMKHNIPHVKIGKLVIAVNDGERETIRQLGQTAEKNGVNVMLMDRKQVNEMEPRVNAAGALYSPETGIINAHALMNYYHRAAKMKGAETIFKTEVTGIEKLAGGYRITTMNGDNEHFEFDTEKVVNAAGLHSDEIAAMTGKTYKLYYCKGDYFSINNVKKGTVKRLVYPVPEKDHVGLGVHLTLDLGGRMKLGPDATYIDRVEDYKIEGNKRDLYYQSASRFLPFLHRDDIVPDMSGIRPKLQGPGDGFRDFVIQEDLPGFINLVGIESPGLTAAPAIAKYVKGLIQ